MRHVRILIYLLDASISLRVVKTHIFKLFLAMVMLFSLASIYILV